MITSIAIIYGGSLLYNMVHTYNVSVTLKGITYGNFIH